jgi:pilus assembly protein CpaE
MKQVLRATGFTFAGESDFGQEALSLATDVRPDVMVVALNEPMERALQTIESLLALLPETPVIAYSQSRDIEAARNAMLAGVRDFLPMPVKPETLRDSIIKSMAAEENRRLRQEGHAGAPPTAGTIITVFGAKGGIGKSTVATNLAVSLAQQGTSTVIVDLDTGFGDVTAMLNVTAERHLGDLVRDVDGVDRNELRQYVALHEASGLDVLASPPVLEWRGIATDDLRRMIELLARYYDKVVLDTSGSITDVSEVALDVATIVLWVTTTEFTSVRDSIDAMKALEALSLPKERTRILVNSVSADDNVRPKTMQEVLGRDVFWQVPYDKRVRQGTHFGQPISIAAPGSVAAKSFADLATVISGGRAENGRKASSGMKWLPRAASAKASD